MVDAGGLNPPGAKALYGFDSHPGHDAKYCEEIGRVGRRRSALVDGALSGDAVLQ